MKVAYYQVNVTRDFAVGVYFPTYEDAFEWIKKNPRKEGYHSIETIFEK